MQFVLCIIELTVSGLKVEGREQTFWHYCNIFQRKQYRKLSLNYVDEYILLLM